MATPSTLVCAQPDPADRAADRLLAAVLDGPVEPATRRLLTTAANGDPVLLRALVRAGLGLGDLARVDGYWRWNTSGSRTGRLANLVEVRAPRITGDQLTAMRMLTEPWSRPYTVVNQVTGAAAGPGDPATTFQLTVRERQILALLADGLTAQAIGRRLRLSHRTVAKHQERMYRKFGTADRLTTVLRAQCLGLLPSIRVRDTPEGNEN
ncbi:response regulator transcription factor [Solwaraspora sp. WMMB335]|uniref:helix-turn-helix transcriptional regulator n=1 Tax=Solwaraspora sp. WMMB335 TaxID=3404118 RepID=UPI003B945F5B